MTPVEVNIVARRGGCGAASGQPVLHASVTFGGQAIHDRSH